MPGIMLRASRLAATALLLSFAPTPFAQAPTTKPAPVQNDPIRVGVELVTTPVIVRDRRGQFLSDLKFEEFQVYEDGVSQAIVTFSLTHGGRLMDVRKPPRSADTEGIILPPSLPTNDTSGRIFIIFVDDLHLEPSSTPRLRNLFDTIVEQMVHPGDLVGVLSSGTSSIAIDLTYDRRRIASAKGRIMAGGLTPRDILAVPVGAQGPPEVNHRVNVALSTAYDLMDQLGKIAGRRKFLIYVSSGYDLNPFADARAKQDAEQSRRPDGQPGDSGTNPFRQQTAFSDADLVSQLAELTRAAVRANVTFYTIDPRGLVAGPDISEPIDMVEWQKYVARSQDTLRVLAEQTGGKAVVNRNDFVTAVKAVDAETSDYYVVGYYSNNPDPTKRRRRIEIRIARQDVEVQHRTEYTLRPPRR